MDSTLIKFSFDVEPTGDPLTVTVEIDGQIVWQKLVDKLYNVKFTCSDIETDHVLKLSLAGKLPQQTKIDDEGNILKDSTVKFSNFSADDIDITQLLQENSQYQHNFNGQGIDTQDNFYGEMGCNGTVEFKFYSPFYLWMLENL